VVLSQRERVIAIGFGAVAVLAVLYWVLLSPMLDWSDTITKDTEAARDVQSKDAKLSHKLVQLNKIYDDMKKNGLKPDVAEAQSQLSHAVNEWAAQSGVNVSSTHSDTPTLVDQRSGFMQVNFQFTCTGTTSGVAKLLYQIESAKIPIRVDNLRIGSKKDGADDLEIQLNLSTLTMPSTPNRPVAFASPLDAR
jgi:type II secretory pathway component PulM